MGRSDDGAMKVSRGFANEPASAAGARYFVAEHLVDLDRDLRDDVALMVSELAANALAHADSAFWVTVSRRGKILRVEVRDSGTGSPELKRPDRSQPTGRGVAIVSKLAHSWGIRPLKRGKVVWFTVRAG